MIQWALQDAKNRFSALVDAALAGQPQQVTRRGKPAVVVLSINEYDRLRNPALGGDASFIEHLLAIPSGAADVEFERMPLSSRASAL